MTRVQLDVPGTEPDHPEIRDAIYAWIDAKKECADESKRLRDVAKIKEQTALDLLTEAGLKSYPYIDRASGKRRRFFEKNEKKGATASAAVSSDRPKRKNDAPVADDKPKPTKAERDAAKVESRKVKRTAEHDRAADPFGRVTGLLDEARARQAEADDEADDEGETP